MYYPKSKIITNLHTDQNVDTAYVIKGTNISYTGYYHKLFTGQLFTGKNPNDFNVRELELDTFIIDKNIIINPEIKYAEYAGLESDSDIDFLMVQNYDKIVNLDITNTTLFPIPYYPQPTQEEYDLGEIQRYFAKKVNEFYFWEINKDEYTALKNKDSKYAFEFFIPFTFAWQIYGNKIDILKINRNTVLLQEQKLKIRGIQEFLKEKYDQFYQYPIVNNLYTNGGELQYANRVEYIGPYHIEVDRGFVIEGQPSMSTPQSTLFSINLEIEKQLLDDALKSIGKFVYPTPIYDVIRKK